VRFAHGGFDVVSALRAARGELPDSQRYTLPFSLIHDSSQRITIAGSAAGNESTANLPLLFRRRDEILQHAKKGLGSLGTFLLYGGSLEKRSNPNVVKGGGTLTVVKVIANLYGVAAISHDGLDDLFARIDANNPTPGPVKAISGTKCTAESPTIVANVNRHMDSDAMSTDHMHIAYEQLVKKNKPILVRALTTAAPHSRDQNAHRVHEAHPRDDRAILRGISQIPTAPHPWFTSDLP
jgi:hypothetical protein